MNTSNVAAALAAVQRLEGRRPPHKAEGVATMILADLRHVILASKRPTRRYAREVWRLSK
jgi:hypothetical protein